MPKKSCTDRKDELHLATGMLAFTFFATTQIALHEQFWLRYSVFFLALELYSRGGQIPSKKNPPSRTLGNGPKNVHENPNP